MYQKSKYGSLWNIEKKTPVIELVEMPVFLFL